MRSGTKQSRNKIGDKLLERIVELSVQLEDDSGKDQRDNSNEHLWRELDDARREKLEKKLFHAAKLVRTCIKKCRVLEIQKVIKKLKEANPKSKESQSTKDEAEAKNPSNSVEKYERELQELKDIDIDKLAVKAIRRRLQEHDKLNKNRIVRSVLKKQEESSYAELTPAETSLVKHKAVREELDSVLRDIEYIILPQCIVVPHRAAEQQEDDETPVQSNTGKRKRGNDSGQSGGSLESTFIESLNGESDDGRKKRRKQKSDLDWEDPEFDKYYNGVKKNRAGQQARRRKWEELYGENANHLVKERRKKAAEKANKKKNTDNKAKKMSKRDEAAAAHPSWQAKVQQQKMMAEALSGNAAPVNKKIIFADADD